MIKDIIRPNNARELEDCWQCTNEAEAKRMQDYLMKTFRIDVQVVSLGECIDLEN